MTVTRQDFELWRAARRGEFGELAKLIREGQDLSPEIRGLVADLLEGKVKNPAHRPNRRLDTIEGQVRLAERVKELEATGLPRKAAVQDVAKEAQCSARTVREGLAKLSQKETAEAEYEAWFKELFLAVLDEQGITQSDKEGVLELARRAGLLGK